MSQVVRVRTQIRDLAALLDAFEDLSFQVNGRKARALKRDSLETTVPWAVTTPEGHQLTLQAASEQSYELTIGPHQLAGKSRQEHEAFVRDVLTPVENRVRQKYARQKVIAEIRKAGFELVSEEDVTKEIRLVVRRFA